MNRLSLLRHVPASLTSVGTPIINTPYGQNVIGACKLAGQSAVMYKNQMHCAFIGPSWWVAGHVANDAALKRPYIVQKAAVVRVVGVIVQVRHIHGRSCDREGMQLIARSWIVSHNSSTALVSKHSNKSRQSKPVSPRTCCIGLMSPIFV